MTDLSNELEADAHFDAITERNEAIDAKVEKEVEARMQDLDCLEGVISDNADILAWLIYKGDVDNIMSEIKRFITNEVERDLNL